MGAGTTMTYRDVLGTFPTGVTIVTIAGDDGDRGLTVSSFTSVSLEPRLVSVCLNRVSATAEHIVPGTPIGISFAAHDQAHIVRQFASHVPDRFAGVETERGEYGALLISGASAHLEGFVHEVLEGGDHIIVLVEVQAARASDREVLLYQHGALTPLGDLVRQH